MQKGWEVPLQINCVMAINCLEKEPKSSGGQIASKVRDDEQSSAKTLNSRDPLERLCDCTCLKFLMIVLYLLILRDQHSVIR